MTYLGTVSAAFNALMRLSLRIHAERTDRDDRARRGILEDPRRLFIPARLLPAPSLVVAARPGARHRRRDRAGFPAGAVAIGVVLDCEQSMPLLIVRHDPERVLDLLLPSFDALARCSAADAALVQPAPAAGSETANGDDAPNSRSEPEAADAEAEPRRPTPHEDGRRASCSSSSTSARTMVREVMTPRPDIVAIRRDATLGQLHTLFREQQYSRMPGLQGDPGQHPGFVFVKDLIAADRRARRPGRSRR